MTVASPPGRFGSVIIKGNVITSFHEKPRGDGAFVNAGFFVLDHACLDYIENPLTVWEQGPLNQLAKEKNLLAFKHLGFWQPMDTMRDKINLNEIWEKDEAPWKIWSN